MKPQAADVLTLLRERPGLGLTPGEARSFLGCDRLAARVCELRREGFVIDTELVKHEPTGGHYARYILREPVQMGLAL